MSMTAGSVTVASDESVTSSGLAKALYDAEIATLSALPTVPTLAATASPYSAARPVTADDVTAAQNARLQILRDVARRSSAQASAFVTYLHANATTTVGGTPYALD